MSLIPGTGVYEIPKDERKKSGPMRTALILTTINTPNILKLYHAHGQISEVASSGVDRRIFIAGDNKTRLEPMQELVDQLPGTVYLSPEVQRNFGYKCSELIGWNCIQRRNIALLEAIRWGADTIITIDDDNAPLVPDYFELFENRLSEPFNGLCARSLSGWFDPGSLLIPNAKHRGFPLSIKSAPCYEPTTGVRVGVAAGLCLGDPDIDAITRIAQAPIAHSVSELARTGVVVDTKQAWTVFNSQNTAFVRELAPAMFMIPGLGRYDDIFASLICQAVMCVRDTHVHFGQPFVWQQRNPHDLLVDLKAEMMGMERVREFAEYLGKNTVPPSGDIFDWLRCLYADLKHCAWWPTQASDAGLAWCDDIEQVLK